MKKEDIINITYQTDNDGKGYKESRKYDGSFSKTQVLRTIISMYSDMVLNHQHELPSDEELHKIADIIENGLKKGANIMEKGTNKNE